MPGHWERVLARAEELACMQGKAIVLFDEAHLAHDWARRLKGLWDGYRRKKQPIHIVATGSSALHLTAGSRESLAGRFESMVLTHGSATALANAFSLRPVEAVKVAVGPGTYPGAFGLRDDLAHAWNSGQRISYWREEPLEVAGVLEGTWGRWAMEVKTGKVQTSDLKALAELTRRYPTLKPLLVCDASSRSVAESAGIESTTWQDFLLLGPPLGLCVRHNARFFRVLV